MRAVVFTASETVQIQDVPEPVCGADQVILRVATAGICGTDIHILRNEHRTAFPIIPGHEFCGTIVEIGAHVDGFTVGDRVSADPNLSCGACGFCRAALPNHCAHWQAIGVTLPGAFAEYVAVPARVCYYLPDDLSDAHAAMIEPLSCVIHALHRAPVQPGEQVLLFGAGPIGLLLAQGLAHSGAAEVVVVERQLARVRLAESLGFTVVVADEHLDARLQMLAPHGFSFVADATGNPRVIEGALRFLRPAGRYLQFGVAPADALVAWNPYELFRNEWTLIGTFALRYSFEPAIAWLRRGLVNVQLLISQTLTLDEFPSGLAAFARGETLKVQIRA